MHLSFDAREDLSETVIYPFMPSQGRGIEDCRLVEFTEEDGSVDYRGTYTAFNGADVRQGLLRTSDFKTYEMRGVQGSHYSGKGMALFPRRVGGRYMMLARQDSENIWLASSDSYCEWDGGEKIVEPKWPWEFIQMGNCGSPIELDEGWLVLTHGVGARRGTIASAPACSTRTIPPSCWPDCRPRCWSPARTHGTATCRTWSTAAARC